MTSANKLGGRPVIIGEVLFDRFPDGNNVLGGAPFNVAWHLQGFGLAPLFVSRVGEDSAGESVRKTMAEWGMDLSALQVDSSHPTGAVDITLRDGQPSFDILAHQAYDYIDVATVLTALADVERSLIYHGSLILRSTASRETVESLTLQTDSPVFTDVNLRAPWWREEDFPGLLTRSCWVKVNDDELEIIAASVGCAGASLSDSAMRLRERFGIALLVVTRGEHGAVAFAEVGDPIEVMPTASETVVDTVGAGDAFASVMVLGLLEGWPLDITMRRGQDFASRIVQQRGATKPDRGLYEGLARQWAG